MKGQVFGIFPTPVLKFKMDREFTKQEIDFVYAQQDKVPQPPYFINLGNIATTSKRILERPEMASLKKIVEDCLNQWCINIYAPRNPESFKLKITQSWLNYTKPGEHHDRHYGNLKWNQTEVVTEFKLPTEPDRDESKVMGAIM